ncbi:hypothetical protein CULT_1450011 [[Clostridium] ultunense Esp]|nr:hypothetical protein CULT_1450011 [[Clostridium] ultunense Esp]
MLNIFMALLKIYKTTWINKVVYHYYYIYISQMKLAQNIPIIQVCITD